MSERAADTPIASVGEAEQVIANLNTILDRLSETIEEETARVRAGRLSEAAELAEDKAELGRRYSDESERVKAARELIARALPDAFEYAAQAARRVPDAAADQSDGAGDRACGLRGYHPRRVGRACAQADAVDLWRLRPRQRAERQGEPATGHQPYALKAAHHHQKSSSRVTDSSKAFFLFC